MRVPQLLTNNQSENLTRQQKRKLQRTHQKACSRLEGLIRKINLPVTFDNNCVTSFGNFGLFEVLKQAIGLVEIVQKHLTVTRHHNCTYSAAEIIDIMIVLP
ncbi:hypothetical protein P378_18450 [Desulforamulus profundi]|uniref:Uncharacterized protein n=1 Tax=Desulforamulus profundi TaxID=1383067 RepID=A0A2C6MC16_9FIRM|nr:hypothetical protein [Desulforamulus profundi]PHJ36672.1 hypothetical protein P378_20905 [Desulforamulus profundi]PHJ37102.1 hypothetical protein P378_18450 [Desulforamulus profundi]